MSGIREEAANRKAAAQKTPITPAQLKYLTRLVEQPGTERFDAEYVKAVKGTGLKPRAPGERTSTASKRLPRRRPTS
ncbi:hypothetical protein OG978_03180 [Streptomyces sp. NBC_01591]|uniref:hypothetical protein n=1 Tax=Streptomyces sp. NBC_01591 TaxID=2975888 RepID=UPI002DD9FBCC|nr:hypothetical protein [Streptomyces sp. NBC_01591]WSD66480.1 hypothetical protein OG978_03180 [Streptomyces sp. NBC_01591]